MNRPTLANIASTPQIPCRPASNQQIPYNSSFMHEMVNALCTYPNIPTYSSYAAPVTHHHTQLQHATSIPAPPGTVRVSTDIRTPYAPIQQHHPVNFRHGPNSNHNNSANLNSLTSTSFPAAAQNEADCKLQYQYDLLVFMQRANQHQLISRDTYISGIIISLWCITNMIAYGFTAELLFFFITILIIHKDLILCNGQSCLPVLLLFNFTIRMTVECAIEFVIHCLTVNQIVVTGDGLNIAFILFVLLFSSQRFIFNVFGDNQIYLHLMRCRLFYRGKYIRWCSFAIYSWFNSLMIIQLMDNVCIKNLSFFGVWRGITIIPCDVVMIGYGVFVLAVWGLFKDYRYPHVHGYNPYLRVVRYTIVEIFVFLFIFVITFGLYELWLTQILVKNLSFVVSIVLFINFVMRDS